MSDALPVHGERLQRTLGMADTWWDVELSTSFAPRERERIGVWPARGYWRAVLDELPRAARAFHV